ncbi:hypothetical protein Q4Q35_20625 [Flavivirga aquimarina]|uniref:Uncharacterized protein n=1 Tax=Flavivirga aquimarina TaxID=2027862 RepID=A0ABT8WGC8_9FLAO|nr:hypothetical protein [Flavivirga aquimarina]MDO5972210.1 hypothetical protein [Flavivirga aquimarina]
MRKIVLLLFIWSGLSVAQNNSELKTIHVYVALCDNLNQGIVPVPKTLGNGQDAKSNLYWGAMYGVKSYFKRSKDWTLISTKTNIDGFVLERLLFKHKTTNTYLLADAYDGKYIKNTTIDFLEATAGRKEVMVISETQELKFGGGSNLLAYIGHDGLMEFDVKGNLKPLNENKRDAIILACISKDYFKPYLKQTKANPLVWSTGLMSPEAYSLKWAIDGWVLNESDMQIRERASQAYHYYQKCGIRGARNLLVTGY